MLYRYEAVDRSGKEVRGAMNAPDEQSVAQRLSGMGYSLKAIYPAKQAAASKGRPSSPTASVAGATTFPVSVASVVKLRSLVVFYRQLATLVRSGISIAQALDDVSKSTRSPKLRRACEDMTARVRSGDKLSSAMAAYPHLFPVHSTGLIWGGELGGYLDTALDEAATEIEQEAKDQRYSSIGWIIAKINLVALLLLIPVLDLKSIFYGGFATIAGLSGDLASGADVQSLLPSGIDTKYMFKAIAMGYWLAFKRFTLPAFIVWIISAFVWSKLKRMPAVRRAIDSMILNVPGWGNLHRERGIERFLKSLHRQYQAGVAPAPAWAAASMSVRNSELASRLRGLDQLLRQPGATLQQAFIQSRVFSVEDAGMIGAGEKSGSVPEMLEKLASHHLDAAGTAKSKARMFSVHALLLFLIISTGFVVIKIVQNYFALVLDVPKWLGPE